MQRFERPFCPVFRTSESCCFGNVLFPLGAFFQQYIVGVLARFLSRAKTFRIVFFIAQDQHLRLARM